jgi:hypothetical protein
VPSGTPGPNPSWEKSAHHYHRPDAAPAAAAAALRRHRGRGGGDGLGAIVPPQVTSVSRKPLSVALERVARLQTAYSDQETGERGYALTGQAAFLEPYVDGSTRAAALTRQLRASLDTEALQERLQQVQKAGAWRRTAGR